MTSACAPPAPPPRDVLAEVRERGTLRVATLNGPATYYLSGHGFAGLDYELASAFARTLGVELEMRVLSNPDALRRSLENGSADLAAAHLSWDDQWEDVGLPAEPHQQVKRLWVYRLGTHRPTSESDLIPLRRRIAVDSRIDALDQLSGGELDAVQISDYEFAFMRSAYPDLGIAFTAPEARRIRWIVRRTGPALLRAVEHFMSTERDSGRLEARIRASLEAPRRLGRIQLREFAADVEQRLPALQPHFELASVRTGLDWRLLAALAYQESRWDPRAKSAQGALGLMMLMPEVLAAQEIRDAFDPRQNILGGARHLLKLKDRLPERIGEPDRTWLAIAAYNAGPGALEDARIVTQMRGKNPDRWADVQASLPLLEIPMWFLRVRNGYSRGTETQLTMDRVREFADLLNWRAAALPQVSSAPISSDPSGSTAR